MKVVFSERAYTAILTETLYKIETETGGIFLGKFIEDTWYIVESLDPGPNALFRVDYFEYDQKYLQHLINRIRLLYPGDLALVGLWHRHPGSFDRFSNTDDGTNSVYAENYEHGAISILVNLEPEFRFTIYHVAPPCKYTCVKEYEVGDHLFPDGLLGYKSHQDLLNRLNGRGAGSSNFQKSTLTDIVQRILPVLRSEHHFDAKVDVLSRVMSTEQLKGLADEISEDVLFLCDEYGLQLESAVQLDSIVVRSHGQSTPAELFFSYHNRAKCYMLSYNTEFFYYQSGLLKKLLSEGDQ